MISLQHFTVVTWSLLYAVYILKTMFNRILAVPLSIQKRIFVMRTTGTMASGANGSWFAEFVYTVAGSCESTGNDDLTWPRRKWIGTMIAMRLAKWTFLYPENTESSQVIRLASRQLLDARYILSYPMGNNSHRWKKRSPPKKNKKTLKNVKTWQK